jgi:MerR family transcriptional regulator, copper efflux regulator
MNSERTILDPVVWYRVYTSDMPAKSRTLNSDTPATYSIGQVAKAAEIGVETVRFYEREGLLAEPSRKSSGYRSYPASAIARLQFIRRAKDLGFTLNEIKQLLEFRRDPESTAADVREQALTKIQDIDSRIRSLQEIRSALELLVSHCHGRGPLSECPILDAMENGRHSATSPKGIQS